MRKTFKRILMKSFAVIDLETDPFKRGEMPAAFAGGIYDGKSMMIYWDDKIPVEGENWYGRKVCHQIVKEALKRGGTYYLHNGGKFDMFHLLDFLPLDDTKCVVIGSRIVKLTVKCGKNSTEFLDSYAIIPKALKSWGKKDISYVLLDRNNRKKHKLEIIDYLKEDLRQLYQMVEQFIGRFGKNLTLASTAFNVMKKQFGVELPKSTEWHDSRFRPWYFAGRVQFFSLGRHDGNFEIFDINSAFPYGMTFPHWFAPEHKELSRIPKKNREQCFYIVKCCPGGALPARAENGSVHFPLDKGIYYACGWELFAGIELGKITQLEILRVFKPTKIRDLGDFVRHFYNAKAKAKAEGDKATEFFNKIILNAGYGKFGIQPKEFRDVSIRTYRSCPCGQNHVDGPVCKEGWEISYEDEQRGITFYHRKTSEHTNRPLRFYNVCTASSITSFVRAMLFKALNSARTPLYCDTDSIIAEKANVPQGVGLGEWKLEMKCDVIWIGGKKLYVAHNAEKKWEKEKLTKDHFYVKGYGWALHGDFKTAAKGVRLPVLDLISVCEGEEKSSSFDAPSYSPFSGSRFVSRRINRADKMKNFSQISKIS